MLKKLMFVAVFVVMLFAISAFAEDYVVIHPETMYQPSYVTDEWQVDSDLSDFPNQHATGRYDRPGRWYHGTQTGQGCIDQDFDGNMGINNGRSSSMYPYSHHGYCGYIGTTNRVYGIIGEGRTARAYDMRNDFFRMRRYDPAYFSPSADPTTDGWVAWRTAGGPAKHTYIPQTSDYAVDYWQRPAHWDLSNTSAADPMDLNATIDRVVMGFSVSKNAVTDDKYIEIAHSQPPVASSRVMTFDNIFGLHSNGTNYVDRVIFRTQLTVAAEETYETHEYNYLNATTMANNYPTTRTGTLGFILIDEPGTANDQFMNYAGGDDDPFISSLIADMRSGRYMMWLVFRAYNYYADGWDQSDPSYHAFNSQRDSGNGDIIIAVGPPATAEDWVLYE